MSLRLAFSVFQVAKKAFDVVARNSLRGITDILSERFKGNAEVRFARLLELHQQRAHAALIRIPSDAGVEAQRRAGIEGGRAIATRRYLRPACSARQLGSARSSECRFEGPAGH